MGGSKGLTGVYTVRRKILANLAINANLPNFFPANTYKDTETTKGLPLYPPKFSSPFATMVAISPKFYPPKFSRVQYQAGSHTLRSGSYTPVVGSYTPARKVQSIIKNVFLIHKSIAICEQQLGTI